MNNEQRYMETGEATTAGLTLRIFESLSLINTSFNLFQSIQSISNMDLIFVVHSDTQTKL